MEPNSVEVTEINNDVEVAIFSVTSEYFIMTQFMSYRLDSKVGAEDDRN